MTKRHLKLQGKLGITYTVDLGLIDEDKIPKELQELPEVKFCCGNEVIKEEFRLKLKEILKTDDVAVIDMGHNIVGVKE